MAEPRHIPVGIPMAERFRRLLEAAPDAMVIADRSGRIVRVNAQTERQFGYQADELVGQPVEILVPAAARAEHAGHRDSLHAAPRPRPMGSGLELFGRRKDGGVFPVEISLAPIEGAGEFLVPAAIRDISERKAAQEALRLSEERFRLPVNEVKDYGIFMIDPTGIVHSWNEGGRRILGYESEEIIGGYFSRFYLSEDIEQGVPEQHLQAAISAGRSEHEGWRIRKDGSRFWAHVITTALHDNDGRLIGFTRVMQDITERKQAKEAFLLEVATALVSNLDLRGLLAAAVASCLRQVKDFDFAILALYEPATKMLKAEALDERSAHEGVQDALISPTGDSPVAWVFNTRKPLLWKGQPQEEWPFKP